MCSRDNKVRVMELNGNVRQLHGPLNATSVDFVFAYLTCFHFSAQGLTLKLFLLHLGCTNEKVISFELELNMYFSNVYYESEFLFTFW